MSILKKLCAVMLSGSLFLCGSGFSNKYEDVQTIELKSNSTTGWNWEVQVREYGELEEECESWCGKVEIAHTFKSDSKDKVICGGGGTDIFSITGKKEGSVTLEFVPVKQAKGCKIVYSNKTIWATFCVNESKQVKIVSFHDSNWCCVNKK